MATTKVAPHTVHGVFLDQYDYDHEHDGQQQHGKGTYDTTKSNTTPSAPPKGKSKRLRRKVS